MSSAKLVTQSGDVVEKQELEEFASSLRGEVIHAGDPTYEQERKIFNGMIDKRPGAIVKCAGVADVISVVNFARDNNILLAIRGAGHNAAGTSLCDDGVVLDLSLMRSVRVDVAAQTARVEAGITWGEFNHELEPFELATTGGFISTTGVSGLTLGGGLGWFVRKYGLALDNLLSADVVTADGSYVTANESEHADLFWALRGGGGNFGVVTSFEFRVHPANEFLAGLIVHPGPQIPAALRHWRDFCRKCPEDLTTSPMLVRAPHAPFVPEEARGQPAVGIGCVHTGPREAGEKALAPLREFGPPAVDLVEKRPFTDAASFGDFLFERGRLNYWKSSFLTELSDEAIDTICDFHLRAPSSQSVIALEHNGDGAMERVDKNATAFGHRNWPYNFLIIAIWEDPAESEANIQWVRDFWSAMKPHLADAVYVNYMGTEDLDEDRVRSAYPPEKYERLVALKTKYDPANLFRLNQNIKPANS